MTINSISASTNIRQAYYTQASRKIEPHTFDEVLKESMAKALTLEEDRLELGTGIYRPITYAPTNMQRAYLLTESDHKIEQPTPDEALKEVTQSITLKTEATLDLGTINGKPFQMELFLQKYRAGELPGDDDVLFIERLVSGSYDPLLHGRVYDPLLHDSLLHGSEERFFDDSGRLVRDVICRVVTSKLEAPTIEEYIKVGHLGGLIDDLHKMVIQGESVDFFNERYSYRRVNKRNGYDENYSYYWEENIKEALQRLGLDPEKPFAINGRRFTLEAGELKEMGTEEEILAARFKAFEAYKQTQDEIEKARGREDYLSGMRNKAEEFSKVVTDYLKKQLSGKTNDEEEDEDDPEGLKKKVREKEEEDKNIFEKDLNLKKMSKNVRDAGSL